MASLRSRALSSSSCQPLQGNLVSRRVHKFVLVVELHRLHFVLVGLHQPRFVLVGLHQLHFALVELHLPQQCLQLERDASYLYQFPKLAHHQRSALTTSSRMH